MDCDPVKEKDIVIDIGSCVYTSKELEIPNLSNDKVVSIRVSSLPMYVDESPMKSGIENSAMLSSNSKHVGESNPDLVKKAKKEKRKSTSAKKPPRPPRGFSLDAADQKLIKEIAELAMIKRARIERMKKMKAAKTASSSGTLVAMLFTVLFCVVIIFQGYHSSGISSSNNNSVTTDGNLLLVQDNWNLSTVSALVTDPGSPNLIESIPRSDRYHDEHKAIE